MSIVLSIDSVQSVLLADGWHDVADSSFDVDTLEYERGTQGVSVRVATDRMWCTFVDADTGKRIDAPTSRVHAVADRYMHSEQVA
jgi:hypothetical protein